MENPGPSTATSEPPPAVRDRANNILATGTVLALLYLGRDVLVPITLAIILSLLIAPLVRLLRRLGLGRVFSVVAAVFVLAVSFAAVAVFIGLDSLFLYLVLKAANARPHTKFVPPDSGQIAVRLASSI